MNPSANKRKMVRMQVEIPVAIFVDKSPKRSDVSIMDLSIHGMSFRSIRFLRQGTQFQILFPDPRQMANSKKIQAEVVRCETVGGGSGGNFKIGAKFLFGSGNSATPENDRPRESCQRLQPVEPRQIAVPFAHETNGGHPAHRGRCNRPDQETWLVRKGEIHAEYCQASRLSADKREETVFTLLKIREISVAGLSASISRNPAVTVEFLHGSGGTAPLTRPWEDRPSLQKISHFI